RKRGGPPTGSSYFQGTGKEPEPFGEWEGARERACDEGGGQADQGGAVEAHVLDPRRGQLADRQEAGSEHRGRAAVRGGEADLPARHRVAESRLGAPSRDHREDAGVAVV